MALTDATILEKLEPLTRLSKGRKEELASLCFLETVNKEIDPLRMNVTQAAQSLYLIKGDLGLRLKDDSKMVLRGGTEAARHAVNVIPNVLDTIALTNIEILRIDSDLLDIMMTWDQLSGSGQPPTVTEVASVGRKTSDWMNDTGVFSAMNLQNGTFSHLPSANIEEMFKRMVSISVPADKVIIQQGSEGDYYYLIQSGTAEVTRINEPGDQPKILAQLREGHAFGEEALVSDTKRNATVTMKTNGELLRLNKKDFTELLKAPLINLVSMKEAEAKVAAGAIWADARLPSEYKYDHIKGAINVQLNEIRTIAQTLDMSKEYVVYCHTGRRSSAAAFILAELGFKKVVVLQDGLKGKA